MPVSSLAAAPICARRFMYSDPSVGVARHLQLPTSSTSRRDGYSCGFDLCLSSKGHSKWMASKRLSAEGHLLQGSWQGIDPTWKDVGNWKRPSPTLRVG